MKQFSVMPGNQQISNAYNGAKRRDMSNEAFNKALSNFTHDFASGGAIRHLADNGFTVMEIHDRLDFPTPASVISETVWKHFVDTGVILLDPPDASKTKEKISFVKEQNSLGKTTFRRVVEITEKPQAEYIACDFGKQIYRDKNAFEKKLEILNERDRDYIFGLPWPLQTVYHIADERFVRIMTKLSDSETSPP